MNLNILYHNCDRSDTVDHAIKNFFESDHLFAKDLFTTVSCWINKEHHFNHSWYVVKLVIHTKKHEDFVCSEESENPYKSFIKSTHKAKKHFKKQLEKMAA